MCGIIPDANQLRMNVMTTKQVKVQASSEADYLNRLAFKFADETSRSWLESTCMLEPFDDGADGYRYDTANYDELCKDDVSDSLDYLRARSPKDLPYVVHFDGSWVWFTEK